jgi:hypothetical protein
VYGNEAVDSNIYDCHYNIDRLKYGPFERYEDVASNSNNVFYDVTFPCHKMSYWLNARPEKESHCLIATISEFLHGFMRIKSMPQAYQLWSPTLPIDYRDFSQSYTVGNCYMIGGAISMALHPKSIINMFPKHKDGKLSHTGLYPIIVYIAGCPTLVHIDDFLAITSKGKFLYAEPRPNGKNVWALLLEKVWSKIMVNYENTVAGWCHEFIHHMTGSAAKDYLVDKLTLSQFEYLIKNAIQEGKFIGGGTKGGGDDSLKLPCGLAQSHAYSILDYREVTNENGELLKMVKIRNPWSEECYSGCTCDSNSIFWTPYMKMQLNHTTCNDGDIWLPTSEMYEAFLYIAINEFNANFFHNYISNQGDDGKLKTFLFTLDKFNEEIHLMVNLYDKRMYPFGMKTEKVRAVYELFVWDPTNQVYTSLGSKSGSDWIGVISKTYTDLAAGHYKVEVTVAWVENAVRDFAVSIQDLEKIYISECVLPGEGFNELQSSEVAGFKPNDNCKYIRLGKCYKADDPSCQDIQVGQGNINQVLPMSIGKEEYLYRTMYNWLDRFKSHPNTKAAFQGWYQDYNIQLPGPDGASMTDIWMYDFSDATK